MPLPIGLHEQNSWVLQIIYPALVFNYGRCGISPTSKQRGSHAPFTDDQSALFGPGSATFRIDFPYHKLSVERETQTPNLRICSPMLYPVELVRHKPYRLILTYCSRLSTTFWLPFMDSNHNKQSQSLPYYRYAKGQKLGSRCWIRTNID